MSSRQCRKLFGGPSIPPPGSDSDDDLFNHYTQTKQTFLSSELAIRPESESPNDSPAKETEGEEACALKTPKKIRKKHKRANRASTSKVQHDDDSDEIDQCVKELNDNLDALFKPESSKNIRGQRLTKILSVQSKYLNAEDELYKLLGPEPPSDNTRRKNIPHERKFKKNFIVNYPDSTTNLRGYGLSMSIDRREGDITYFTFDHSKKYQDIHRSFLTIISNTNANILLSREQILKSLHIEGMLELVDVLLYIEEYNEAFSILKKIISIYQYVAHPNFTFTNPNIRLEYQVLENRPFFIAILKYIYLLSNKFCHRTALELSKLLLSLDPSDPLNLFAIIDVLALRAREHQWLIDVIKEKFLSNDAVEMLAPLKYSYALAKYHVAVKNGDDLNDANQILQNSIISCPLVVNDLLDCFSGIKKDYIEKHDLFSRKSPISGWKLVSAHTELYAKLVSPRWREPKVLKWFLDNISQVMNSPPSRPPLGTSFENNVKLGRSWPANALRHVCVIKAMSDLVADGAGPAVKRCSASNPIPPLSSIDRYKYYKVHPQRDENNSTRLSPRRSMLRNPQFENIVRLVELLLIRKNIVDPDTVITFSLLVLSTYLMTLSVALKILTAPRTYSEACMEYE